MDAAIQVVQFYEANYPEYLRRVFVINGRWRGGGGSTVVTQLILFLTPFLFDFSLRLSSENLQSGVCHHQAVPQRSHGQ